MCDDLFDDGDGSFDNSHADDVAGKLWVKTTSGLHKEGYRVGRDAGQEATLQQGFNAAFSISTKALFMIAELRGLISGKLAYSLLKGDNLPPKTKTSLEELLEIVQAYEKELLSVSKNSHSDKNKQTHDQQLAECSAKVNEFRQKFCEIINHV